MQVMVKCGIQRSELIHTVWMLQIQLGLCKFMQDIGVYVKLHLCNDATLDKVEGNILLVDIICYCFFFFI